MMVLNPSMKHIEVGSNMSDAISRHIDNTIVDPPNPGTDEAIEQGCKCPIMDNGHGLGYLGGMKSEEGNTLFVYTQGCPLHWPNGKCEDCNGTGIGGEVEHVTPVCCGQGTDECCGEPIPDFQIEVVPCEFCNGYGEIPKDLYEQQS